jgi:hypothetical protein
MARIYGLVSLLPVLIKDHPEEASDRGSEFLAYRDPAIGDRIDGHIQIVILSGIPANHLVGGFFSDLNFFSNQTTKNLMDLQTHLPGNDYYRIALHSDIYRRKKPKWLWA